jgi:hypothetical protein
MTGIQMIENERERQISAEGWTAEHDAEHDTYELTGAARCYALQAMCRGAVTDPPPPGWPWDEDWWKPSADPVRNLVKAGALIAAEIDRLITQGGG